MQPVHANLQTWLCSGKGKEGIDFSLMNDLQYQTITKNIVPMPLVQSISFYFSICTIHATSPCQPTNGFVVAKVKKV